MIGWSISPASRCHSRADQESVLQLHESLPPGFEWQWSWGYKFLHVYQWSIWGGFHSEYHKFQNFEKSFFKFCCVFFLYSKLTITVQVLSDPIQRMIYDEIHGYSLTSINPFLDDSSPKDHVFVDEFSCIGTCCHSNENYNVIL